MIEVNQHSTESSVRYNHKKHVLDAKFDHFLSEKPVGVRPGSLKVPIVGCGGDQERGCRG